jgi:hypothetical protein
VLVEQTGGAVSDGITVNEEDTNNAYYRADDDKPRGIDQAAQASLLTDDEEDERFNSMCDSFGVLISTCFPRCTPARVQAFSCLCVLLLLLPPLLLLLSHGMQATGRWCRHGFVRHGDTAV